MPEYDQMVDKYLAMGYSINNAEEYATEEWKEESDVSYGNRHALRMASRRRVA
jgi:hypothetical protein